MKLVLCQPMKGMSVSSASMTNATMMFTTMPAVIEPKVNFLPHFLHRPQYMSQRMHTKTIHSSPKSGKASMMAPHKEWFLTILAMSSSNILSPQLAN